jgi:hypothetical protein
VFGLLYLLPGAREISPLLCCLPHVFRFFMLVTWRKGVTLETEFNELFEMLSPG